MNIKHTILFLIVVIPALSIAQTSYIVPGTKEQIVLERIEIKMRTPHLSLSHLKPYNRRDVVNEMELADSLYYNKIASAKHITAIDKYNVQRFLMNNSEWSKPREAYKSEKLIAKTFFPTRGNLVEINNKDFFFAGNLIFQYQQMKESGTSGKNVFLNTRGAVFRGIIANRIGFSFYLTENQERQPFYVQQWVSKYRGVPTAGFFKPFKNDGYDYFDIRSSISFKVAKFMDMQLAYDRNFIGNGYRSLFLGNDNTNMMFLKVNTRFKKFNYQNIFAELVAPYSRSSDYIYPRKYFRMTHLSYQLTKSINIGLFNAVMLGRTDKMSFTLFNPIIFANIQDKKAQVDDKSYTGFDFKANIAKRFQVYGQLLNDNFGSGKSWNNRYGYQFGGKYIDALGFKNVDIQVETNSVRPFTYSSDNSITSYNHYNMPLAHPLGSNFQEFIVIIRAQPTKKLYLEAKAIYYKQGLDSSIAGVNQNYGNNIFTFNTTRPFDNDWSIGTGDKATCTIITLLASYELKENLFFDISLLQRNFKRSVSGSNNVSVVSAGVRWNIGRREFLF